MKDNWFNDTNKIIAKVLSGEASPDEIIAFSEWIKENKQNKQEFQLLSEFWEIRPEDENLMAEISFENNKARFFTQQSVNSSPEALILKKKFRMLILSIAASFLIILSVGIYYFMYQSASQENYHYISQNNISYFTLPDGSKITLNKGSKLTFSNKFMKKERKVILEGEAYFEVEKNTEKKFIVQVGNSQVEVLGTKFNINAREVDERIVTTLIEGTVLFRNRKQEIKMTPNQQLTYHTQSGLIENVNIDAALAVTWKDGVYRYNSILLSKLARELGQRYNTEIVVNNKFNNIKVSGTFLKNQSIEEVLNIIQHSIGFKWTKKNDRIIIY